MTFANQIFLSACFIYILYIYKLQKLFFNNAVLCHFVRRVKIVIFAFPPKNGEGLFISGDL